MESILGLHAHELEWYQMAARAIFVFFVALIFIRVAGMRSFGNRSAFDVVLSITIGAILSRCITGHYPFFACLSAAAVLALCHRFTAFAATASENFRKLAEGDPVELFRDGTMKEKRVRKHSLNRNDVERAMHEENLEDLDKIKAIILETDGKISIIKK
jgi:uncharacterized membrane protein YcaP (DUF421 family)